jgi:hypothetical protein
MRLGVARTPYAFQACTSAFVPGMAVRDLRWGSPPLAAMPGPHGYRVTALKLVARVDEAIGNGRTRCL